MIRYGANDWNIGLYNACLNGNVKIVELMIDSGGLYWNHSLYSACYGGNIEIVKLIMDK